MEGLIGERKNSKVLKVLIYTLGYADVGQWYSGSLENCFPSGYPGSIPGVGVFKKKVYKGGFCKFNMAATPPAAQKRKIDWNIDRATYDAFMKACSLKGFAPQVIVEQAMRKFVQNGQI